MGRPVAYAGVLRKAGSSSGEPPLRQTRVAGGSCCCPMLIPLLFYFKKHHIYNPVSFCSKVKRAIWFYIQIFPC